MPELKYISDLHLDGRGNLEEEHPGYSSLEQWHRDFVDKWNIEVSSDDIIWIAGDVCLNLSPAIEEVLKALKGHLNMTIGNHDSVTPRSAHHSYFEQILDIAHIVDKQRYVVVCHYPMDSWNRKIFGSCHVHGHIHDNFWDSPMVLRNRYNAWSVELGGVPRTLDWFMEQYGYDSGFYRTLADQYEVNRVVANDYARRRIMVEQNFVEGRE